MNAFTPSFLVKNRFGIYQFRCRIPANIRKKYNLKKNEIRKSLRTGNRTEALRLSRLLWVQMEKTDYTMANLEADKDRHDRLFREGKPLYKELQELESKPDYVPTETEDFMDWLSPFQKEALMTVQMYFAERGEQLKVPSQVSILPPPNKEPTTDDLADNIVEKIQNAKTKRLTKIGIKDAFEKYLPLAIKLNGWKKTYTRKKKADIQLFINILSESRITECGDITSSNIIKYRDTLSQLPSKFSDKPAYKGKAYCEIIGNDNLKMTTCANPNLTTLNFG